MRLYDIISEAESIPKVKTAMGRNKYIGFMYDKLDDGSVKVTFPDGNSQVAKDSKTARAMSDNFIKNDSAIIKNKESPVRAVRNPSSNISSDDAKISTKGLYPSGTPIWDQLSTTEKTILVKMKAIKLDGRVFTKDQIEQATSDYKQALKDGGKLDRRRLTDPDPSTDKTASANKNPKPTSSRFAFIKRFLAGLAKGGAGAVGSVVNFGLSAVSVEEELDQFLRIIQKEYDTQYANGVKDPVWNQACQKAHDEVIDSTIEAVFKGVIASLLTAAAGAGIWGILAAVIGTGGTSIIAAIVLGGAIGFLGTEGLYRLFRAGGLDESIREYLQESLLSASNVEAWAKGVDAVLSDDPWFGGDPKESLQTESKSNINTKQASENIKKVVQNNPELLKAFNKGKAKGLEVYKSLEQR